MTNRWLMGAAAAALTVAGAFAAQAADLPTRKEAPAPVFVPPPFTWTGFYIGVNAGGIWSTRQHDHRRPSIAQRFPCAVQRFSRRSSGTSSSGFIGGGQAGYNWQSGAFVLGVETDFDGTSLSKNVSFIGADVHFDPIRRSGQRLLHRQRLDASLDWLGTTRARVGFVATPDNRLMIYGTGGVAYGGGSAHLNVFDAVNNFGCWQRLVAAQTRIGWTIGGGVEYAWTNNITFGAEYLYYDLGSIPLRLTVHQPSAASQLSAAAAFISTKVRLRWLDRSAPASATSSDLRSVVAHRKSESPRRTAVVWASRS